MKEQFESLLVLLRSAARFRWLALGIALALTLFGAVAVLCLPDRYESRAQIFVDSRSILRPLLQGLAVAPATQDQADMVRRALLARPSIDKVARSTGIINRAETPAAREALITSLADQITIKGESSLGLYTISYPDSDPQMSKSVVDTLLKAFVENSVGEGREDAHSAEQFLERQVADYGKRLFDSEQRLADFKKKNVGLMPDQRGDYFGRMQTERAALDKLRTDLNIARRQREALLGKIRGDSSAPVTATALPTATEIQAATSIDARIRESRKHLDELLLKFTEKHPEVIALTDTIKRLEEQRRTELGGIRATSSGESSSGSSSGDPVMQNLQIALNSADVQIASLEAQVSDADGRVGQLERLVTTGPEVEAELVRLNRDYGVTKTQYEALLQRLETARLSKDADRSDDIRFKILDPAHLPLKPVKPNRLLLLVGVLFGSIGLAVVVAVGLALTMPVFWTAASLTRSTGLPVVGVVGRSFSNAQRFAVRRSALAYSFIAALGIVGLATTAVFSHPASQALRRLFRLESA